MASIKIPDFSDWRNAFWGFGRVIRNGEGRIYRIVELKDASKEEQWVTDLNPSYFCFNSDWLWTNLEKISNDNAQNEYYLTDITEIARDEDALINEYPLSDIAEAMGANTPELAELRISVNQIGQPDQEPNESAEATDKKECEPIVILAVSDNIIFRTYQRSSPIPKMSCFWLQNFVSREP